MILDARVCISETYNVPGKILIFQMWRSILIITWWSFKLIKLHPWDITLPTFNQLSKPHQFSQASLTVQLTAMLLFKCFHQLLNKNSLNIFQVVTVSWCTSLYKSLQVQGARAKQANTQNGKHKRTEASANNRDIPTCMYAPIKCI